MLVGISRVPSTTHDRQKPGGFYDALFWAFETVLSLCNAAAPEVFLLIAL